MVRLLFLFFIFCMAGTAQAATLYIDPATATLNRGDAITLAVRLDTDEALGECINAVDGVITYDASIVPVDISLGSSIFPVWVETPVIDKENRRITFAGGIPNGYCGRVEGDPRLTNVLLELVLRAPGLQVGGGEASGVATIAWAPETTAYLNDGLGSKAPLGTLGTTLTLNPTIGQEIVDAWRLEVSDDTLPPEEFSIALERSETAFEGKYFIVFNTTDKQTGLSHYEVIEETNEKAKLFGFGAATAPWERARSPYILKDQSLTSTIRVRAVDKAGNEYVATLLPTERGVTIPWLFIALAGAGVTVILASAIFMLALKRRNRKRAERLAAESILVNDNNV